MIFLPAIGSAIAVETESPLQIVGTVNAICAKLAERAGFRAVYLSGAGVANASYGLPDLGMTTLDACIDRRRSRCSRNRFAIAGRYRYGLGNHGLDSRPRLKR